MLAESTGVVRAVPGVLIVRHRLGFTSANAAIDRSNADGSEHTALLMPSTPTGRPGRSATLVAAFGVPIGVVISDTHGRPWRRGNVGVAVGVAGIEPLIDRSGAVDLFGRELKATLIPIADQLAGAPRPSCRVRPTRASSSCSCAASRSMRATAPPPTSPTPRRPTSSPDGR